MTRQDTPSITEILEQPKTVTLRQMDWDTIAVALLTSDWDENKERMNDLYHQIKKQVNR